MSCFKCLNTFVACVKGESLAITWDNNLYTTAVLSRLGLLITCSSCSCLVQRLKMII